MILTNNSKFNIVNINARIKNSFHLGNSINTVTIKKRNDLVSLIFFIISDIFVHSIDLTRE